MQGFQPGGLVQFFLSSGLAYRVGRGRKFSAFTKPPEGLPIMYFYLDSNKRFWIGQDLNRFAGLMFNS